MGLHITLFTVLTYKTAERVSVSETVMIGDRNKSRFFCTSRITAQPPLNVTCFGQVFSSNATEFRVKKKKERISSNPSCVPWGHFGITTAATQTMYMRKTCERSVAE